MSEIRVGAAEKAFRDKVLADHAARRLMACYQCGACSSDCPVAKRVQEFRPRNIARLAMYGQKRRLLEGDLLWLCAGCYTCYERCPQQVHVSEIVAALRRLGAEEGVAHATIRGLVKTLGELGYIYEIGEFENEMRGDDGLPPAPTPAVEEVNAILEKTGVKRRIGGKQD